MTRTNSFSFLIALTLLVLVSFVLPVVALAGALEDAVDNPMQPDGVTPLVFTTGGGALWTTDTTTTYFNGVSLKSGGASMSNVSSMLTTTVIGPSSTSFYQKVSSEPIYDGLSFYIDNMATPKYKATGTVNWQQKVFTLPTGTHTLQWKYSKNGSINKGSDDAWVDKVVVSPNTSLKVTYPNGGDNLISGSTVTITWNAPAAAEKYDLYYTTNNGTSWTKISSGFPSPNLTGVTYPWPVPVPAGGNKTACRIKVVAKNNAGVVVGTDISDKLFAVQVLKVTSPNGGESLNAHTTSYFPITFTISGQQNATSATISYTMDNGVSWHAITTMKGVFPAGDYTYSNWNVPAITALKTACKVKVVLKNSAGVVLGADVSDANFTITPVYSISGTVTVYGTGAARSGVTMALSGDSSATTWTDWYGRYSFKKLLNGNYTITPSHGLDTLIPASKNKTIADASLTGVSFSAKLYVDKTPPSVPAGLFVSAATPTSTTVNLSWAPSTDDVGVWGYKIYKNGVYLKSWGWDTHTTDTVASLTANYCYAVSAFDQAGNESAPCAQFCVDRVPPTVPSIQSAIPIYPSQVDLLWTAATDTGSGVAGYNLYRDGVQVKSSITGTAGANGGLAQGTSYCFTVTAFDKASNESLQSAPTCTTTLLWQYEFVTQSTNTSSAQSMNNGEWSAMAMDSAGHLHAVYENDNTWPSPTVQYATNALGSWATTTLVPDLIWEGIAVSMATDTNDKVHVSYWAQNTSDLLYMTNSLGSWSTTTIYSGSVNVPSGTCNSLAIDNNNHVHISFCDGSGTILKYATNASGNWVTTTVDTDSGYDITGSSIAIDSQGHAHISYIGSTNSGEGVKYATNASGDWVITTVNGDVSCYITSIGVDSAGKVHIAYNHWFYGILHYITNASGQWTDTYIDAPGNSVEAGDELMLKIDKNDKVHIVYQEQNSYDSPQYSTLKHATNASGEWYAVYVVDPAVNLNLGYTNTLSFGPDNKLHISTYDAHQLGMEHWFY